MVMHRFIPFEGMLKTRILIFSLTIYIVGLFSSISSAQTTGDTALQLIGNGYTNYEELGAEWFVAGLFLVEPEKSATTILGSNSAKRMELKVLSRRLSIRKLAGHFVQGAAINNSPEVLEQYAESMAEFSSLFKKALRQNDHLILSSTANQGVSVSLNGIDVGEVETENFFSVLLSAWIGAFHQVQNLGISYLERMNQRN